MRMSDWSSDGCASDLPLGERSGLGRFGRDLGLAGVVIAIIVMLIVPLPGWLLDLGLAISIAASVMILMAALMVERRFSYRPFRRSPSSSRCCGSSEARRCGKGGVRACSTRWWQ